ncbi:unnamed protein product, partial [Mesorhabditis belari]|uniref:valine--tRNA ligase n=1 Tax=Mesorhabditis belari TaxID=2138241 RepID=A0AAF3EWT5_9BILA
MKHENAQVMICSRSGDVIEPRLMKQWNLDVKPLHLAALQAIERGKLKIAPMGQTQRVIDWLENTDPWCLSRQLYWGHRIPAFTTGDVTDERWTIARDSNKAATTLGCHVEDLRQESDVLDTWFSSSLVPLVVSGWCSSSTSTTIPHFTSPPLNIMETGHDIIGFWVTRMIAMTLHLTNGTLPFSNVFLHGLVRDSSGRKMSKSLGNVIDPLDVLDGISLEQMLKRLDESNLDKQEIGLAKEDLRKNYPNGIPKSGADALRFALLRHDVSATDVPIAVSQLVDEGLRFCNKLWNLTNYVLILHNSSTRNFTDIFTNETDLWLLSRLHALFDFLIGDLCDVYLETTKKYLWSKDQARINEVCSVLNHVLPRSLAQLSIFMPFAAQAMYERTKTLNDCDFYDFILKQEPNRVNPALDTQMRFTLSIVSTIRSLRAQLNLPKTISFDGFLRSNESSPIHPLFNELNSLCGLRLLQEQPSSSKEYVIYPVHGYDVQLNIKIQDEHREEFNRLLEKQNEHINQRIEKQTEVVKGANQMAERDANDPKAKSDKKERSARRAKSEMMKLEGLRAESKRLQTLVDKQKNLIK